MLIIDNFVNCMMQPWNLKCQDGLTKVEYVQFYIRDITMQPKIWYCRNALQSKIGFTFLYIFGNSLFNYNKKSVAVIYISNHMLCHSKVQKKHMLVDKTLHITLHKHIIWRLMLILILLYGGDICESISSSYTLYFTFYILHNTLAD